jgi:hypothetical protein
VGLENSCLEFGVYQIYVCSSHPDTEAGITIILTKRVIETWIVDWMFWVPVSGLP